MEVIYVVIKNGGYNIECCAAFSKQSDADNYVDDRQYIYPDDVFSIAICPFNYGDTDGNSTSFTG